MTWQKRCRQNSKPSRESWLPDRIPNSHRCSVGSPASSFQRVAKSLLLEGKIAGEEYLNLISDRPMKIRGVEDMTLYMKSVESYGTLVGKREEILSYLTAVQNVVQFGDVNPCSPSVSIQSVPSELGPGEHPLLSRSHSRCPRRRACAGGHVAGRDEHGGRGHAALVLEHGLP